MAADRRTGGGTIKGIAFRPDLAQLVHDDKKHVTRRLLNPQPRSFPCFGCFGDTEKGNTCGVCGNTKVNLRFSPGEIVYVKESWRYFGGKEYEYQQDPSQVMYLADPGNYCGKWKPAMFMPEWASRTRLCILDVRVERLQEITEEDAEAEGCEPTYRRETDTLAVSARSAFRELWDEINPKHPWDSNPFVSRIEFERVTP